MPSTVSITGAESLRLSEPDRQEAYLNLVMDQYGKSLRYYSKWRQATNGWYDLWRGYWSGRADSGWNNVHIPIAFAITLSDVARLMQVVHGGISGGQPEVQAIPTGPEDHETARKSERLIEAQKSHAKFMRTSERAALHANLYGACHVYDGWKVRYGPITSTVGRESGRAIKFPGNFPNNLRFNGPESTVIRPLDALPQAGVQDLDEMLGFGRQWYAEFEDIQAQASSQLMEDAPVYDPDVVRRMGESTPNPAIDQHRVERRLLESSDSPTWGRIGMMQKPVHMIEYVTRVPRHLGAWYDPQTGIMSREEFAGSRYMTTFVITVADQKWVLRAVPNPEGADEKPINKISLYEDPAGYYPPGKLEICSKINVAINRMTNNVLDAQDRWIDPPWIINYHAPIDWTNAHAGPGARIWTEGATSDEDIRQLQPNIQWVNNAFGPIEMLFNWAQRATGITDDISFGFKSGGRQSATEFAGRSEAVSVRIALEALRYEHMFIEPSAMRYWEQSRRFLDTPHMIRQIGAHAVFDPITERWTMPEAVQFFGPDFEKEFNFRSIGATKQLSKAARQQNLNAFLPALVPLLPALNQRAFVRQILPVMDFTNVDELVASEEQYLQNLTLGLGVQDRNQSRKTNGPDGGVGKAANDPLSNVRHLLTSPDAVPAP